MVAQKTVTTKQLDRYIHFFDREANYIEILLDNKREDCFTTRLTQALNRKFRKLSTQLQGQKLVKLCNSTNKATTQVIVTRLNTQFPWYDLGLPKPFSLVTPLTP
jgi:hypothetical protein